MKETLAGLRNSCWWPLQDKTTSLKALITVRREALHHPLPAASAAQETPRERCSKMYLLVELGALESWWSGVGCHFDSHAIHCHSLRLQNSRRETRRHCKVLTQVYKYRQYTDESEGENIFPKPSRALTKAKFQAVREPWCMQENPSATPRRSSCFPVNVKAECSWQVKTVL